MIKLTDYYDKTPVYVDPYKVSTITCYNKKTTAVTVGNGYCLVAESPEEVVKMIEEAIE